MLININDTSEFYSKIIQTLENGNIVALPTDTVYGFAVDGTQPNAVEKLARAKKREKKPFTFFISKGDITKYAIPIKRRIIEYFIPGPITVILRMRQGVSLPFISSLSTNEKIGIRIPQVDFIIKLLNLYNKPLAVTSANISGQPPINSAVEIVEKFTEVELVINGGELVSKPSTTIDLTSTPPTVLRKGKIPILELEKVYGRIVRLDNSLRFNVLFVCSANTCRSPMAEGIFKTMISNEICEVKSAGILPMEGFSAAQHSVDVVKEYGGSIEDHQTKKITKELIDWADLILVMEYKNYNGILETLPQAAVKTFFLKEYKRKVKYNEISDPVGRGIDVYRETAEDMVPSLKLLARDIRRRFKNANLQITNDK
jgi:tRNA threonylcarbamoyl adenosine modification protein (Sua5/YciO/YrdC/YwlC family)